MYFFNINIRNYKSLKNVRIEPSTLSVLVGPNASGKTNFSNAISFLVEVYQHGLEVAVARKGGFDNLAFRRARRTKSRIEFSITSQFDPEDLPSLIRRQNTDDDFFVITHHFSFKAERDSIRSGYTIVYEKISVEAGRIKSPENASDEDGVGVEYDDVVDYIRDANGVRAKFADSRFKKLLSERFRIFNEDMSTMKIGDQELLIEIPTFRNPFVTLFLKKMSNIGVFQFSPSHCRMPTVPTPNPRLASNGNNLASVIDWLKHHYEEKWKIIVHSMRSLVPNLEDIVIDYVTHNMLGIFFKEKQITKNWDSNEISDGTIQVLAILVATTDPRHSVVFIEEPENSIHPWILKELMSYLKTVAEEKPIILTSHSPYLIDTLRPIEAWITYKQNGETKIRNLIKIDRQIQEQWKNGKIKLSEFLDSGLLPKAVPGGVQ